MPRTFLIIDGYNMLFALGGPPRQYRQGELQKERERLLELLSMTLSRKQKFDTTIVFDAKNSPSGIPNNETVNGIVVQFAGNEGCADQEIEDLISAHSAPRQILLVSSDHRLQRHAKKRKAKFIDSSEFLLKLLPSEDFDLDEENSHAPQKPQNRSVTHAEDVTHWLEIFGDIETKEPGKANADPRKKLQRDIDAIIEEES